MKIQICLLIYVLICVCSCTFDGDAKKNASKSEKKTVNAVPSSIPVQSATQNHDKSFETLSRYFEQGDSIHREVWRVVADIQLPMGKTPFGKVQRALMAHEGFKLGNKSQFSCDNYSVKKHVKSTIGFPQQAEIYEVCNKREGAKKIASYEAQSARDVKVEFYPENLRDILGLGPTVMNKTIVCKMRASEALQLQTMKCENWSQDQKDPEMLSFTAYDFDRNRKKMIAIKGKVFKDLTDVRSIDIVIPQDGKILITETELYAPEEETKTVVTVPPPRPPKEDDSHAYLKKKSQQQNQRPPLVIPDDPNVPELHHGHELIPLDGAESFKAPGAPQNVDPDVLSQQQNVDNPQPGDYGNPQVPDQKQQMDTGEDFELPVIDQNGELRER